MLDPRIGRAERDSGEERKQAHAARVEQRSHLVTLAEMCLAVNLRRMGTKA